MLIERKQYVDKLFSKSWNGKVKIITGIRRCGKSFLLRTLYKQALMNNGVSASSFIEIDLEKGEFAAYRNPVTLEEYVRERAKDKRKKLYLFVDEIQRSYKVKTSDVDEKLVPEEDRELLYTTFYDTLSSLM